MLQKLLKPVQNHREFERFEHVVAVSVMPRRAGTPVLDCAIVPAICRNISRGGMCVLTDRPLDEATVHVRFPTVDGVYVTQPAAIVRSLQRVDGSWEHGIRFSTPLPTHLIDFLEVPRD